MLRSTRRRGGGPTPRRRARAPRRTLPRVVLLVVGGMLVMWIVSVVALAMYSNDHRGPQRFDLVIPQGTTALVQTGANPLAIPAQWSLRSGDVLVLDNRDSVVATFGAWNVAPGEQREIVLRPFTGLIECTLHPAGSVSLTVAPVRSDWTLPLVVALVFGPLLGFVGFVVFKVRDVLDRPSTDAGPAAVVARPLGPSWLTMSVGGLAVVAVATTMITIEPWKGSQDAVLRGFTESPVRDVSAFHLPDAVSGTDRHLVAPQGGLLLLTFGYTSCPDVCPTTMSMLAKARAALGADADRVQIALVSIDPQRDTAPIMAGYVQNFVAGGEALRTDDRDVLDGVVAGFGASYQLGTPGANGAYEVAHSAFVYAVDDTGRVIVEWPDEIGAPAIIHDLHLLLGSSTRPVTA